MPNFGLNVAYTYHSSYDIPRWNPRIGLTSADYTAGPTTSALGYSAVAYQPEPGEGRCLQRRAHPE